MLVSSRSQQCCAIFVGKREIRKIVEYRWFARVISRRNRSSRWGGGRRNPAVVSGVEDEAYCKNQWNGGILHWQCYCVRQTRQTENRSWGGTLESFILRELSTVIISSWCRIERATLNDRFVWEFYFSRESRWRSVWNFYSPRERPFHS